MPAWLIPAITAAASLAGNLFNTGSTKRTNQRQQDFNSQLYDRQRADALADYERNNAYNSPSQQMQRFKEAGLNPNLVYGQMQNAAPVRSTDAKAPDFVAPRIDTSQVGNILGSYYDIKQKDLTIKQQQKAIELADQDIINKKLKNNYDSSFTYSTEVGGIRKQQLQESVDKTIEDWNMTRELRSMNPLKADQVKAQTENVLNSIKIANLDYQQKAQTNEIIRRAMEQAIKLQGNRYELDKLSNELVNSLRRKAMLNTEQSNDITKDLIQLLKTLY